MKPRSIQPSCFGGGHINFRLHAEPVPVTTQVPQPDALVYLDAQHARTFEVTDTPLVEPVRRNGQLLYTDANGGTTTNADNGDADNPVDHTQQTAQVSDAQPPVDAPVFWQPDGSKGTTDTGDRVMDFGTMEARFEQLAKQKNANGQRLAYPGDPSNPVGPWSESALTMEEVKALQTLFAGFLARQAAAHSLHPTPAAATAAEA